MAIDDVHKINKKNMFDKSKLEWLTQQEQNKDTDAHSEDYLQEPGQNQQLNTSQVPHV